MRFASVCLIDGRIPSVCPIFLNAEAQRRGGAENRTRRFNAWRGSGRRTTARNRWVGKPFRRLAFVTVSRPSGLRSESAASPLLSPIVKWNVPPFQTGEGVGGTDAPAARRPGGGMAATNARVRSRQGSHRWSAIVRSPSVPPSIYDTAGSNQQQRLCALCVFAVIKTRTRGWCRLAQ